MSDFILNVILLRPSYSHREWRINFGGTSGISVVYAYKAHRRARREDLRVEFWLANCL